jgi:hypothetical protein
VSTHPDHLTALAPALLIAEKKQNTRLGDARNV